MLLFLSLFACNDEKETPLSTNSEAMSCEGNVCILTGTITEDVVLTADNQYLLRGGVFIGDDETETILEIEPGTTVYGESSTDGMLVIRRNSKIIAISNNSYLSSIPY